MKLSTAIQLAKDIKWKSVDRDNMEFEVRTTCFVRDAIRELIDLAEHSELLEAEVLEDIRQKRQETE
jgi:hypothetical protein